MAIGNGWGVILLVLEPSGRKVFSDNFAYISFDCGQVTRRKPKQAHGEHANSTQKGPGQDSETGTSCCEATMLPIAPQDHPKIRWGKIFQNFATNNWRATWWHCPIVADMCKGAPACCGNTLIPWGNRQYTPLWEAEPKCPPASISPPGVSYCSTVKPMTKQNQPRAATTL